MHALRRLRSRAEVDDLPARSADVMVQRRPMASLVAEAGVQLREPTVKLVEAAEGASIVSIPG